MTTTDPSPAATTARPSLRVARERFLSGRPLPQGVPEEVVAAWRRARFFGVPHDLEEPVARSPLPGESALLGAARPVLDRIVPALGAGGSLLVLTDERLRVLWTAGSEPGFGACEGLSEQEVGHNSAALALRTRGRAEVHGPEHFLDRWQEVSAVSVPVFGPESGRVLGTLTVASRLCAAGPPHPQAAFAEATVAAVETELRARAGRGERALLDAYVRAARGPDRAVAALDGRNRLVSDAAQRLLTPEVLGVLERTAAGARHRDVTGLTRLPEGAGCTAHVTPVRLDGRTIGIVAALEPLDDPAPAAPAPPAALTGSSASWRHAVGRAVELVRSGEPLLLTGERGTGKTALARELCGPDPVQVTDAARDAGLDQAPSAWQPDRLLLLRHAERLAQPGVAALNSLLEQHPDTRLLVTYTPGVPVGPCLQRLLDKLSARSVTLPPLRERTEDIRELLPALTPRPAPGQPPLTWTLDALRALEAYPWPGNVTELAHVVRALAEHRRASGPVRRAELPDAVREGPAARPLSPMEHAERAAILEALRRHGGNKARTAVALGIGRATLYRKLREYRH
ncbi:Transcriptional regulator of acetoin/glycerol metabolism [Streptomyces sp. Ag82_O1-12]|uniref:sigma-54-dependent Fis family transcriptional regulator n=1 Tax=unclassified Streptomyces TaxID=2593676 RepID=UPI000BD35B12|nr:MULTISPECIES: helix-turn-helix domain-containing protein [unclassified Streptomyces]SMQ20239.1 Transcriptional regulator of acetoin/glycerol metabolism [Streptomyces sp. Ag82_O1-12]SOD49162.1 Transcriptional regulator of acetoin/glycerol metabolism [Streptomyces sp. Ag82_G6-1]